MAPTPNFPNPGFAWSFYFLVIAFLTVAAIVDLRRAVIPKWLSLTGLALGVACNLVRGAWMGAYEMEVWRLGNNGVWTGAADGLLFALAGFATGFGIFFFLWITGGCAGGDVKLFAALSSWIGAYISLRVFVLSTLILIILLGLRMVGMFVFRSPHGIQPRTADKKDKAPVARDPRMKRGVTYALPLALATALALLWFFRFDLHLTLGAT